MPDKPRVQSFTLNDDQGRPVRFTVGTDIIDYAESARAFGREDLAATDAHGRFQRRLFAFPDRKAAVLSPMVVSIGSQNGLFLIRRQDGSESTAWKLTDLGASFKTAVGSNPQVRALGVGWTDDDRITLAVSVDAGGDNAASRVFVAWNLSSKTSDWDKVPWIDCGSRENIRVEGIRVLDEGTGVWTVVLAGNRGAEGTLFLIRSSRPSHAFADALVFTPAVTMQEIYDFQAGVDPMTGPGIAIVGQSGGSTVLSFRPFPKYTPEGKIRSTPPTVPLPCPQGARLLDTGVTRNEGTDLYIAGEGVHMIAASEFDNLDQAAVTQVASPQASTDVLTLVAADAEDGSASAWTVQRNGNLNIARRKAGEKSWGNPLRLRPGVRDIAPVQGDRHAVTSILIVYSDGRASFLWQDAAAGVWQETPLLVANPEQITKATCYGTSFRVLDSNGLPRRGVKVTVSASVLANVVANRHSVFLGPGLSFETETDANGGVSIFDSVRSLTPAILRFTIDGMQQSIDVNPAGGIHQRFNEITADQLRKATVTTPDGRSSPLLPDDFRTGALRNQLDAVAGGLNQAASLAKSADGIAGGVSAVPPAAAYSSTLRLEALPANYRWGIEADSNGVRAASSSTIDSLTSAAASAGRFFVNLGESIADFFEGVWNKVKDGWTFVLEKAKDGINFICKIGDSIRRWVLQTLEEIGSFFTWLWDQVKTAMEKLWAWLKFIFDWKDILRVRDAMLSLTDQALLHFERSIDGMKTNVDAGFEELMKMVRSWGGSSSSGSSGAGATLIGGAMSVMNSVSSVVDQIMGNSIVAWVMNKLQSLLDLIVQIELPDVSASLKAAMDGFERLLAGSVGAVADISVKLAETVQRVLGQAFDPNNLSVEAVQRIFVSAGAGLMDALIAAVRNLLLGSMDIMKALVGLCRALMNAKMRFPFIEQLVNALTLGLVSIDTTFRMGDGIMLLLAIPATIAYKLIMGEAPFRSGETFVLPFGRVTVSNGSDPLRLLMIFGPLVASLAKIGMGYSSVTEAIKDAPTWHSVSPLTAVFAVIGLAAEIAIMHFDGSGGLIAIESLMAYMTAYITVYWVYVAFKNQGQITPAQRLEWSEMLGGLGTMMALGHICLRGGQFHLLKDEQSKADELIRSGGFFEDYALYISGFARFDSNKEYRPKILGAAIGVRVVCASLCIAGAVLALKS